jgi:Fe-S-cluster-containing hydrogenase component 2
VQETTRVLLRFTKEIVEQPIISQVILEKKIPVNILSAHIDQQGGEILAEIPETDAEKAVKAFREKGVTVDVRKLIEVDDERCIDCGACVSLCPVAAITFDEDNSVIFNDKKCLGVTCGLCVDACPVRAIGGVK